MVKQLGKAASTFTETMLGPYMEATIYYIYYIHDALFRHYCNYPFQEGIRYTYNIFFFELNVLN